MRHIAACLACLAVVACAVEAAKETDYDVIVVGGGIAGLTAARNLLRANHTVLVLEARAVLGGRSNRSVVATDDGTVVPCTLEECQGGLSDGKYWWDQGGQWVGPTQTWFLDMIKEYEIDLYESNHILGFSKVYFGNNTSAKLPPEFFNGLPMPEGSLDSLTEDQMADLAAEEELAHKLYELADTVNVTHPWETPGAEELDGQTFQTWLERESNSTYAKRAVASLYPVAGGALGGLKPAHVSLLHVARQMKAAPQVDKPEKWLLWGAAGQLVLRLSEEIEALGGILRTSSPVTHINQTAEGIVEVEADSSTPGGADTTYTSKYVVVAMPPHLTGQIIHTPDLPRARNQLTDRTPMGTTVKVLAFYSEPYWHKGGNVTRAITAALDPEGYTSASNRYVDSVYDVSPPGGPGVLASFLWADDALQLMDKGPEEVRKAVLSTWAEYTETEEVKTKALAFHAVDWPKEQYIGGAFTSYMPPGVWTTFGAALTEPVCNIHWAGTENSPRWPGFYDGAIFTGEEAAKTVSALLQADKLA